MKDYPMELLVKTGSERDGVFSNPFHANVYIRRNCFIGLRNWESDNVCVVIMVQVGLIHFEQVLICAKNIVESTGFQTLFPKQAFDKGLQFGAFREVEAWNEEMKINCSFKNHCSKIVNLFI